MGTHDGCLTGFSTTTFANLLGHCITESAAKQFEKHIEIYLFAMWTWGQADVGVKWPSKPVNVNLCPRLSSERRMLERPIQSNTSPYRQYVTRMKSTRCPPITYWEPELDRVLEGTSGCKATADSTQIWIVKARRANKDSIVSEKHFD